METNKSYGEQLREDLQMIQRIAAKYAMKSAIESMEEVMEE